MSNVKAIGTCVCYCLDRVHLDNELKASSEEEAQLAFQSLQQLLASNQKRNAAISKNLAAAKDPSSKLSKLIVSSQEITTSPFLQALRNPNSKFCISWDIFGFIALLYYAVSIPYHVAYLLHDDLIGYRPYLVFDFLVDVYWILDIYFRLYYFTSPRQTTNKYETDVLRNLNHYRNTHRFKFDCITSFPLEVFALVPGTSPILVHFLRLLHLGKVFNIYNQINMLHLHLDYIDVRYTSLPYLSLSFPLPFLPPTLSLFLFSCFVFHITFQNKLCGCYAIQVMHYLCSDCSLDCLWIFHDPSILLATRLHHLGYRGWISDF